MEKRPAWMDQDAPVNYVAGIGRGATGFTTRSDIGPARMQAAPDQAIPMVRKSEDDEKEDYSESNFDAFEGYGGSFVDPNATYDQDDKEADDVWESVEEKMDKRRKERREARIKEEIEKYRQERPTITAQFADLKEELKSVSVDEWDAIPEIGDTTQRFRKKAKVNMGYMPVPDSLLEQARRENEQYTTIDTRQQAYGGLETPLSGTASTTSGIATPLSDLTQVGTARQQMLGLNLNRLQDSVGGQTNLDPKDYLSGLGSIKISTDTEIGDIKKARLLLKSVRQTNPHHGPAWIASARLEELAGKLVQARKLIAEGLNVCQDNPDVWIEAARLNTPENAKIILARAIKHVPKSVKIWVQACELESEPSAKKIVLRKALEQIPNSPTLWKSAVELEGPEEARILLGRAVECVPHVVEMWLALAHLETYENARKVLNKARETIPTDASIWITAAKLEEAHGNRSAVGVIIKRAIKSLTAHQVVITRDQWIKEAEDAEKTGGVETCQAIIRETIGMNVEDEDRKRTWAEDAETSLGRGAIETSRAIYAHALTVFPNKKSLWLRVAHLEKEHGTPATLDAVLKKAVSCCPKSEILWLMAAKEQWLAGHLDEARSILGNAFSANPDSEQIWLAAVKLENENNEPVRARGLLQKARERAGTERVWLKSAELERDLGNTSEEQTLLDEALKKFPQYPKFWMMRAQLEERRSQFPAARELYLRGLKNCGHSLPLWLCAAQLEEQLNGAGAARSLLEKARLRNPKSPELWLASVRIETRAQNPKAAQAQLAKGLQECPNAGILWAETIALEAPVQRKARSLDALKRCDNDAHVIVAVAQVFWADRKLDKARHWFQRAIAINPDLGDAWAAWYKFEQHHGTSEQQEQVIAKCQTADPHHGELWCRIRKDIKNSRLSLPEVLKRVAALLPNPLTL